MRTLGRQNVLTQEDGKLTSRPYLSQFGILFYERMLECHRLDIPTNTGHDDKPSPKTLSIPIQLSATLYVPIDPFWFPYSFSFDTRMLCMHAKFTNGDTLDRTFYTTLAPMLAAPTSPIRMPAPTPTKTPTPTPTAPIDATLFYFITARVHGRRLQRFSVSVEPWSGGGWHRGAVESWGADESHFVH